MMSSNSRQLSICARCAWFLALTAAIATPAAAETYRCVSQDTGRSYVVSQDVPGDKCVFISKNSPHPSASHIDEQVVASQREAAELKRQAKAFAEADAASKIRSDGLALGMTPQLVRASSWGSPKEVQRVTNYDGVGERWLYGGRKVLHFENGVLVAIFE
jgi:hypothetical protein